MSSKKPPRPWLLVLLTALPLTSQAPPEVAARILEEGLGNSQVMEFQDFLCNNIGGRLTGSDNYRLACEWARSEFERMGLDARLEKWAEAKVVWNRGQWAGRMLEPNSVELFVATPAWTAGTKGEQRGELIRMPTDKGELDALRARLKNEPGVYLYGSPPGSGRGRGRRGGQGQTENPVAADIRKLIADGEVLGTVQRGNGDRNYDNQIRVFGDRNGYLKEYESRSRTVEIHVRADHAAVLEDALSGDDAVIVAFDIRNRFRPGPFDIHNVVAELQGTEKPDEVIVVCGHLDSWHQAQGATDNGTGSCSTLEAARILTAVGARPKRTIRFILWGGEEQGLRGSVQYVTQHRAELDKISGVFNHDNGTNWAQAITVPGSQYDDFTKVMAPVMSMPVPSKGDFDGPVFEVRKTNPNRRRRGGGGSDHASFLARGVPAYGWRLQGERPYGYGWHSQWDRYDIVVPEYQAHNATVIALCALGVANLPDMLSREGFEVASAERAQRGPANATAVNAARFRAELDGLKISSVGEGGLAARAGIEAGDVIVAMWGKAVANVRDVNAAFRDNQEAATVKITVQRGDDKVELEAARRRRRR